MPGPTKKNTHAVAGPRSRSQTQQAAHREQAANAGLRMHEHGSAAALQAFLLDAAIQLTAAARVLLVLDAPGGMQLAGARLRQRESTATLLAAVTPWLEESRRTRAARLRHGPDGAEPSDQRSCLVAPLIAHRALLGFLYAEAGTAALRAAWPQRLNDSTSIAARDPPARRGQRCRPAGLVRRRVRTRDEARLDIAMPEMDGFQVLEVLTKDLRLRDLPVIVTSAVEGMESVVRCIECGAEDYLHKPVNPVLLRARIGASLEKKRLRDQQRELVRRFATREVADDLVASGFRLGGHRVQATVMFSDIRGFTTMSEQLPPEETIELLNTYYTLMFDAISGHGGVVNQMIGDGLMAIFGAPLPLADPCGSAARAAQEMIEMVELFNQQPDRAGKPPIAIGIGIGIGIASGSVIAGYTGTDERATYTCVGDTVNLAARLEAHTRLAGHSILMDRDTQAALDEAFSTAALGPVLFKGKHAEVDVFALRTA